MINRKFRRIINTDKSCRVEEITNKINTIEEARCHMKIKTAEIKMLIKQCIQVGEIYTTEDFAEYIKKNSAKEFTRGQLSGAIAQLIDAKSIVRIDRGLYSKNVEKVSEEKQQSENKQDSFHKDMYELLDDFLEKLETSLNSVNIGTIDEKKLQSLLEVRNLKNKVEMVKALFE